MLWSGHVRLKLWASFYAGIQTKSDHDRTQITVPTCAAGHAMAHSPDSLNDHWRSKQAVEHNKTELALTNTALFLTDPTLDDSHLGQTNRITTLKENEARYTWHIRAKTIAQIPTDSLTRSATMLSERLRPIIYRVRSKGERREHQEPKRSQGLRKFECPIEP